MALVNNGSFYDNNTTSAQQKFETSKRRLNQKKQQLEDMQNEYDLLEQQALNLYKSNVTYWKLDGDFVIGARSWIRMLETNTDLDGNKLDKRKKYTEKHYYEYLIDELSKLLGVDIQLESIIDYNYGDAWEFVFRAKGRKWLLRVPIVQHIGLKSFQYEGENCFKLRLSCYESDHVTSLVGSTFEEDDLADIMEEGIKKYCKE